MNVHTVGGAVRGYLFSCQAEAKSPQTIRWYRQKLTYFADTVTNEGSDICEVTRGDVRAFLAHLQRDVRSGQNNPRRPEQPRPLSQHTVHGYARALRAFFSWAQREGIIQESPMRGMRMPKLPSLVMASFSDEEARALLDPANYPGAMGVRNHTMVVLLLDTGIRVAELVGLRMGEVYLAEGYFTVRGKGNKERNVPMGRRCQTTLHRYIREHRVAPAMVRVDHVFLTQRGRAITTDWVYKIISTTCRRLGMRGERLGPHTCRHTFAKRFLMNGGDLLTLQRILGHASLEVVRGYVSLNTQDLLIQQRRFSPVDALAPSS